MAEPTTLHRCQVTTWDAGITTLCEKPAALYKGKWTDKTYKLCPHHFIGFASDLDPISSGERARSDAER